MSHFGAGTSTAAAGSSDEDDGPLVVWADASGDASGGEADQRSVWQLCSTDWSGTLLSVLVIVLIPLIVYQTRPLPNVPSLPSLRKEAAKLRAEVDRLRENPLSAISATGALTIPVPAVAVAPAPPAATTKVSAISTETLAAPLTKDGVVACHGHTDGAKCIAGWTVIQPSHQIGVGPNGVGDTCRQSIDQVWGYRCPSDCKRGMPFFCQQK